MVRHRGVACQRADHQSAVGSGFDLCERKSVDVHQLVWPLDVELHQIDRASCRRRRSGHPHTAVPSSTWLRPARPDLRWSVGCTGRSALLSSCERDQADLCAAACLHCGDDVRVCAAAADISIHCLLHVIIRWPDRLGQHRDRRHNLTRSAVAALVSVVLHEGCLHGMKMFPAGRCPRSS